MGKGNSLGTYAWEKMNKAQNKRDNEINSPVKLNTDNETTGPEYTKSTTPAGENRTIEKEDNTNRRKSIDKALDDAEK